MASERFLTWPVLWRTFLILLGLTIVFQLLGVALREGLGLPIQPSWIAGGVGATTVFIVMWVRQRLLKERSGGGQAGE